MAVNRYFSSVAQPTTLAGNISAGATTISVQSPTGYPGSFPFTAAIGYGTATEELVDVTAATGGTWTVVRGVDGTSAQSHSIGEAVEHVTSARDSAEFQNHQAASAAVHGVTGSVVGTTDAQTLTNKTLTAPAVNGGALSGTFTGAPTFSGNVVFSGTPNFTGAPNLGAGASLAGTFTGSPTLSGNPTFSGTPTFSGGPSFTTASAFFSRTTTNGITQRTQVTPSDTQNRHEVWADGTHAWGPGNATQDTALARTGAATMGFTGNLNVSQALAVSGNASVGGSFSAANLQLGAWTGWVPTWTTTTGAHSPSYGNAAVVGVYCKLGRLVQLSLTITFGNTTVFGAGAGTGDNWQLSLPPGVTASTDFQNGTLAFGGGRASHGAVAAPVILRMNAAGDGFILDLNGGKSDATAPANSGTLDSVTPWTWASGDSIQVYGTFAASS